MNVNEDSSGFVKEDFSSDNTSSNMMETFHLSKDGFNCLFRCKRFGRLHILKALKSEYRGEAFYESALQKEFNIGYQLEHPNICHTLGWENIEDIGNCILLEYIDGITLKDFLKQGMLTRELAYKFIFELCNALAYLHRKQIIHRDLKPTNIIITHNGNNVKLIDFGLSDCDDYDILKLPAGTRYYMAPEMVQGNQTLDLRVDIYSLGVIIGEIAEAIGDKHLAMVSRRCTQQIPEKRYASADQVATAARQAFEKRKGRRYLITAVFCAAILTLIILMSYLYQRQDSQSKMLSEPVLLVRQGNISINENCRKILANEAVHRQQTSLQMSADSIQLLQTLRTALDKDYPLVQQRESSIYLKQWEMIEREVHKLYTKK